MSKKSQHKSKRTQSKSKSNSLLRNPLVQIGILAVVALVIYLLAVSAGKGGGLPATVSVDEAYAMYQDGAFVLDVREPSEWDEYHAPGTTLIPLGELAARVNELPRDKPIVVICRSGNRSQEGRDILLAAGFTQVTSMAGGLKEWRTAGYPIEP